MRLLALWRLFPASHYVLLSLLFVLGLELAFALQRWIWFVGSILLGLMIIGIVLVRLEEGGRFRISHAVLPFFTAVGLALFSVFLPTSGLIHFYIGAAGLLFFFSLNHAARQAYPIWNWAVTLVAFFLNIAAVFGFAFHLYFSTLGVLSAVFVVGAALVFQGLSRVVPDIPSLLLPTLGMALGLSQLAWVVQFLPVHYLVGAAILTLIYYIAFNLIVISYSRTLARADILEYVGLGVIATLIIIVTARWIY